MDGQASPPPHTVPGQFAESAVITVRFSGGGMAPRVETQRAPDSLNKQKLLHSVQARRDGRNDEQEQRA